jgi:hypothetical protein
MMGSMEVASVPTLAAKLAEVMGEVGWIPKKGRNTFQNYDFVRETDIVDAVSKHLAARKVAIIPRVVNMHFEPTTTQKGVAGFFAVVTMSYTFVDGDSGEKLEVEAVGAGTDQPGDKAFYKAQTGAKKFALTQTFLIATGDDPEDEQGEKPKANKPRSSAARSAPKSATELAGPTPDDKWKEEPAEPQGELLDRAEMIRLRKAIRAGRPDHPAVLDGSIGSMTLEELKGIAQ